jgi:hypothetical protein
MARPSAATKARVAAMEAEQAAVAARDQEIDAIAAQVIDRIHPERDVIQEEEDNDLDRVIGELRGQGNSPPIRLYRMIPGTRREAYLGNIPPEVHSALEYVKDTYGGGSFKVKIFGDNGKLRVNESFDIEGTYRPPAQAGLAGQAAQSDTTLRDLITSMMTQQKESMEQLIRVVLSQNQGHSRTEWLNDLSLMKNLFGASSQPSLDPMQLMNIFTKGVEFAKDIVPHDGEASANDILLAAVKEFMPVIARVAEAKGVTLPTGPEPALPGYNGLRQGETPPMPQLNPAQEELVLSPQEMMLKGALNYLVSRAAGESDPTLYAEIVLDSAPDEAIQALTTAPDWFEQIVRVNPNVAPYREWFTKLRESVITFINTPPDPSEGSGEIE